MSLRTLAFGSLGLAVVILASCAPRPAPPQPAPPPPPAPAPTPPPAPPPPVEWEDAAASPGDWRLDGTAAAFGAQGPEFVLRCEGGRQVSLIRTGARDGAALTIRTSYGARALPAAPVAEGLAARLAASDPLLDAIAFSRGRFAVEAPGLPRLIIPAWPEPARVVEDCRS